MKQFLRNTVIFASPILLIAICFEILLRKIPNDYVYKKEYLDKNSSKIKILFLGNSHAYYGINPEYINVRSFNAAYVSQSLNYDLAILKKYETKWNSLQYIVLPIDYFSLFLTLETGIEEWRVKNYSIYYGIHLTHDDISTNTEILSNQFMVNITRLCSYYFAGMNNIGCSSLGWGTGNKSKGKLDSLRLIIDGASAAKRHTAGSDLFFSRNIATLKSIIEFSRSKNIQVVFFTSPAYKTYSQRLDSNQLNNTVHSAIRIANSYNNARYFNLLNDSDFTVKDFFDADHLNEIGAKKLTLKIYSLLVRLK